ncbi:hypothetical protein PZA11_002701 [Diplocarpon coronariae]
MAQRSIPSHCAREPRGREPGGGSSSRPTSGISTIRNLHPDERRQEGRDARGGAAARRKERWGIRKRVDESCVLWTRSSRELREVRRPNCKKTPGERPSHPCQMPASQSSWRV